MNDLITDLTYNTMSSRDDIEDGLRSEQDREEVRLIAQDSSPYSVKITRPDGSLFYISGQSLRSHTYNSRNNTYTKKPEVFINKVSSKVLDLPFSS